MAITSQPLFAAKITKPEVSVGEARHSGRVIEAEESYAHVSFRAFLFLIEHLSQCFETCMVFTPILLLFNGQMLMDHRQ